MADSHGLIRNQLLGALGTMDLILGSPGTDQNGMITKPHAWTITAPALDAHGHRVDPDSSEAASWSIMGVAWHVAGKYYPNRQFPFQQICMALFVTIGQPMITIQEYESRLSFSQMKEWLARAIDHAKNNDPWKPYID